MIQKGTERAGKGPGWWVLPLVLLRQQLQSGVSAIPQKLFCLKVNHCLCTPSSRLFSYSLLDPKHISIMDSEFVHLMDRLKSWTMWSWASTVPELHKLKRLRSDKSNQPTALMSSGVMNKQLHHLCAYRDDKHIWLCGRRTQRETM